MSLTRHDRGSVAYVAFLSGCVGIGYLLTSVGGLSLFIERVGVERLPFLYVIGALLNIAIGTLDSRVLQRMRQGSRLLGVGIAGGAIAITIGVFTLIGPSYAGGFVAPLAYEVVYIFGPLIASAVALHRFDLRQMKRLYSPASSARWVAQILAGLAVARFADRVEPGVLLVAGGVVLVVAAVVARIAVGNDAPEINSAHEASGAYDSSPTRTLGSYGLVILVITIISTVMLVIVDFIVFAQAENDLDTDAFASFLSLLHAAQAGFILVLSSLGGRAISRFGLRFGLLVTPVVTAIAAAALLLVTSVDVLLGAALAIASVLYVLENGFRYSMGIPSRQLLFQPLPPTNARRMHGLAEGPAIATGILVSSGILGLTVALGGGARAATAALLGLALLTIPIAFVARRKYVDQLDAAVTRRQLGQGIDISQDVRAQLVDTLADPDPNRAMSALRLLGDADSATLGPWSDHLLTNNHEALLRVGLDWAETSRFSPSDASLEHLLTNRQVDWVLRHRAGTLARRRGATWISDTVQQLVDDGDLAGIAMTREDAPRSPPSPVADIAISDGTHSERLLLAEVLALNGGPSDVPAVLEALADPDADVRRAAAPAIVRLGGETLWRRAAELVDDEQLYATIDDLFDSGRGDSALIKRLANPELSNRRRTRLARLLARSPNHGDDNPVWTLIADHDSTVRSAVLAELSRRRTVVTADRAESLRDDLTRIAERCDGVAWAAAQHTRNTQSQRVVAALLELLQRERVTLAHGLAVLGYGSRARGLAAAIADESDRSRAQALELLEEATALEDRRFLRSLEGRPAVRSTTQSNRDPKGAEVGDDHRHWSHDRWVSLLWDVEVGDRGDPMALSTIERVLALRATPLFSATPSPVLMDMAPGMDEQTFATSDTIFQPGDPGEHLFVILSGAVEIVVADRVITRLDPGDAFGEASLLEDEPRSSTARAADPTKVLAIHRHAFRDLMIDQPEVSIEMLRYVSQRTRLRDVHEAGA